ncbi:hypothetical protein FACS1894178_8870 [Bacteroidia bacterium]|nr:hypothetical protein FACS1894178_8870 [Bacteroidia bacterium]
MENTWFKDIPLWIVISIFLVPIVAILLKIFVVDKKIHKQPIKIRRKRLLILLIIFLFTLLTIGIVGYFCGVNMWSGLLDNPAGCLMLFVIIPIIYLRAFFYKDKKSTEDDSKDKISQNEKKENYE